MLIELHGGGFHNKGAQLMLFTAREQLRERLGADCCVESERNHPAADCARSGLLRLFPPAPIERARQQSRMLRISAAAGHWLPRCALHAAGLVRRQDPTALVDISGFAFGDAGPPRIVRNFSQRCAHYAATGRPVILLPQMFGPFSDPQERAAMRRVLRCATLVCPRDPVSHDHLRALGVPGARLRPGPDITINDLHRAVAAPVAPAAPYACLVVNKQILNHRADEWGGAAGYIARLAAAGRHLRAQGLQLSVVIHAGGGQDQPLAERLVAELGPASSTFTDADPRVLKRHIAGARILVGSRFHAVLAALSTGVPALVIGWAHKYEAILADFGHPEWIHPAAAGPEHLTGLIDAVLARRDTATGLCARSAAMQRELAALWFEVATILRRGAVR